MFHSLPALRTFVLDLMSLYTSCDCFYAASGFYVKAKFLVHSFGVDEFSFSFSCFILQTGTQ